MKMRRFVCLDNHELQMDFILADYQYPILFTCLDEEKNMYVVTCFHADAKEKEWLIANTTPERIKGLLTNCITIRDVFSSDDGEVYLAKLTRDSDNPIVKKQPIGSVNPHYLPTPNIYMDAEEDEFKEEISILNARIELLKQKAALNEISSISLPKNITLLYAKLKQNIYRIGLNDNDYVITSIPTAKRVTWYA